MTLFKKRIIELRFQREGLFDLMLSSFLQPWSPFESGRADFSLSLLLLLEMSAPHRLGLLWVLGLYQQQALGGATTQL